ncbi:hypothetical protein P4H66_11990 [Paenibacillus dokdonensis]|uniref:Uncharacterized protein n=1 Tax=Paenibacillus dokdonensis TaxID=2567944 RepID=A0ABU6GLE8_9BACL|nr:hypothetical protein [Paenibacillus dokdonensis]MEC0240575.1 hypothetical protein [Paenibacillus dokdonensis]
MGANHRVKLSQWDALMLEGLRAYGWSNEELLRRISERDLPMDTSIFEFDYLALAEFASAEPETFESAVKDGYSIKYNTLGGLRSWLAVAYGLEPEVVREPGQEAVIAEMTTEQKERLASVISFGWLIQDEAGKPGVFRMEPIQR